jgi:two-component system CheB/CheR fusion protein
LQEQAPPPRHPGRLAPGPKRKSRKKSGNRLIPIVGVGASAGGFEAFKELLQALPERTGMAFVLVSHLSQKYKSMLSELLGRATPMPVTQVTKTTSVEPNRVYVIPPNVDLEISDGKLKTKPLAAEGKRPHMAIDYFFRSLAREQGSRAVGVVLSGTGTDGTLGLAAIKAEGGITFVQDEETAKYPDMPRSANVGADSADFVLSPSGIARELARIASHPYVSEERHRPPEAARQAQDELAQVFRLVRGVSGVDFAHYKPWKGKRHDTTLSNAEQELASLRTNQPTKNCKARMRRWRRPKRSCRLRMKS